MIRLLRPRLITFADSFASKPRKEKTLSGHMIKRDLAGVGGAADIGVAIEVDTPPSANLGNGLGKAVYVLKATTGGTLRTKEV